MLTAVNPSVFALVRLGVVRRYPGLCGVKLLDVLRVEATVRQSARFAKRE
jgi:hypothetical protein